MGDDIMADLDFWAPSAVLDFTHQFVPVRSLVPTGIIRWYLKCFEIKTWFGGKTIFSDHMDFVESVIKDNKEGYEMFVVGHSLGGALASALGAKFNIPSVTFSPVGQDLTLLRFGIDGQSNFWRTHTAIIPETDVVPLIDKQVGTTVPISCKKNA